MLQVLRPKLQHLGSSVLRFWPCSTKSSRPGMSQWKDNQQSLENAFHRFIAALPFSGAERQGRRQPADDQDQSDADALGDSHLVFLTRVYSHRRRMFVTRRAFAPEPCQKPGGASHIPPYGSECPYQTDREKSKLVRTIS